MQTRNLGSKQKVTVGRGRNQLPESISGESVSRAGFEIGLESKGTVLVREGGGKDNPEWCIRCGGWIFAAVVLVETALEVSCEAGVAESGVGYALKAVDVVPALEALCWDALFLHRLHRSIHEGGHLGGMILVKFD